MLYLLKVLNNFLKICLNGMVPGWDLMRDRKRRGYGRILLAMYACALGVTAYTASAGMAILGDPPRLMFLMFSFVYLCVASISGVCLARRYRYPYLTKSILFSKISLVSAVLALAASSVYVVNPYVNAATNIFIVSPMPKVEQYLPAVTGGTSEGVPARAGKDGGKGPGKDGGKGRLNVLLIGSDADVDRYGARTDSMNVVSIDLETLNTTVIGIPRNLKNAPIPEYLRDKYFPRGYQNLLNTLYWWGERHPKAVESAVGGGDYPGATLLSYSVATLLGMPLDAWILVDMGGFINVIDAAGGVHVYVDKDLSVPGPVSGSKETTTDLNEGWHYMDGTNALSFTRSRKTDSDYSRMGRQRCLLASLAAQKDPIDLLTRWPAIAAVLGANVKTNLDPNLLGVLVGLSGSDATGVKFLGLTPPLVPAEGWDAEFVKKIVYSTVYDVPYEEISPEPALTEVIAPVWTPGVDTPTATEETPEPALGLEGAGNESQPGSAPIDDAVDGDAEGGEGGSTTSTTLRRPVTVPPAKTAGEVCKLKP